MRVSRQHSGGSGWLCICVGRAPSVLQGVARIIGRPSQSARTCRHSSCDVLMSADMSLRSPVPLRLASAPGIAAQAATSQPMLGPVWAQLSTHVTKSALLWRPACEGLLLGSSAQRYFRVIWSDVGRDADAVWSSSRAFFACFIAASSALPRSRSNDWSPAVLSAGRHEHGSTTFVRPFLNIAFLRVNLPSASISNYPSARLRRPPIFGPHVMQVLVGRRRRLF